MKISGNIFVYKISPAIFSWMRWVGHLAYVEKMRNAYILAVKPQRNSWRPKNKENNSKINPGETV
jgi:hypothetical protein